MKYKVGDKVKIRKGSLAGNIYTISHIESCGHIELSDLPYVFFDYELEPVVPTLAEIKEKKLTCVIHTKTKREAIMLVEILGVDEERLYDKNDFIECWDGHKENTCYRIRNGKVDQMDCVKFYQKINEEIYEFSDLFATGGTVSIHDLPTSEWYNPMRIDLPEFAFDAEQAKELAERLNKELAGRFNAFPNNGISAKNGGKNSMKFTFYVKEGTRPDKKCNGTIPTMTTNIELFDGNVFDYVTTIRGSATCDKADYDERQGVLEALANAVCGGEFKKRYSKAVKANKDADLIMRTCTYCGKVCDTSEEKIEHEKWHVERKKARRERYLLRKRAKEIAFEEQAQKMAKEMIKEDK